MAWRPNEQFTEGELDNRVPGKVTGWMKFAGMNKEIAFNLEGNFHRDIRGAKIRLTGNGKSADAEESKKYMEGFCILQTGVVGDITAGLAPQDYGDSPYIEWYSDDNGRCVLELESDQVEILTSPIPFCESDPLDRKQQAENMAGFLGGMAKALDIPENNAVAIANTDAVETAKKVLANNKIRKMKLLPNEIRDQLPPLYSQDGKGGRIIAYVRYFCPDSSWIWYGCEFDGKDTFFGLVEGFEKELGYFSLTELESARGKMGLPIERDLYFKPTRLVDIAPEIFPDENEEL